MAAEVRDLAFTIRAIDSASSTVDEIAAKLERASEGQARSVANAQRQIAAIIARGDPAKAQAVALEKELAQLKAYGDRARASEETIAAARRKIIEDFEANRLSVSQRTSDAMVSATGATKGALGELKQGIGDVGQLANNLAGSFDATGQKVTGLVQSMVSSFASGGPVALAIGGTIALLTAWKSELDEIKRYSAEAAKAAADAQQGYNDELDRTLSRLREEKEIRGVEAAGGSKRSLELQRTATGAEELAATRADQLAAVDAKIAEQRKGLEDFLASPDAEDSSVTGMNEAGRQGRKRAVDAAVAQLEQQRAELQKQYEKEIEVAKLAGEAYQAEIVELDAKRAKLAEATTAAPSRGRRMAAKKAPEPTKAAEEKFVPGEASLWTPYDQFMADRAAAEFRQQQAAAEKLAEEQKRADAKAASDREKLLRESAAEKLRSDQEMAKAAAEAMKAEQEAFAEAGQIAAQTFAQGFKAAMDGEDTRSIIKGVLQGVAGIASVIPGGQVFGVGAGIVSQFLRSGGPVLPQGRGGLATMINNDGIPAVLHPNEFVLDSESVNAAGGVGRLEALRRDLKGGGASRRAPASGSVVNVVAFDQQTMLDTIGKAVEPAQYRRVSNRQGSKARDAARKAASRPRSGM